MHFFDPLQNKPPVNRQGVGVDGCEKNRARFLMACEAYFIWSLETSLKVFLNGSNMQRWIWRPGHKKAENEKVTLNWTTFRRLYLVHISDSLNVGNFMYVSVLHTVIDSLRVVNHMLRKVWWMVCKNCAGVNLQSNIRFCYYWFHLLFSFRHIFGNIIHKPYFLRTFITLSLQFTVIYFINEIHF